MHDFIHTIYELYVDGRFMVCYIAKPLWIALNNKQVRTDSEVSADKTTSSAGHGTWTISVPISHKDTRGSAFQLHII